MLAHNVFFALKEKSQAPALLAACRKYLTGHPGVVFFACGTVAEGLDRPVNVRDWDVALHLVFDSRASHDLYQDAPRHHQFMAENREGWALVRVFDSIVEGTSAG